MVKTLDPCLLKAKMNSSESVSHHGYREKPGNIHIKTLMEDLKKFCLLKTSSEIKSRRSKARLERLLVRIVLNLLCQLMD